jgi:hypothetical protein
MPMEIALPRWSPTGFLVYAGGFMTLGAAGGWLGYFSVRYGDAAYAAWAFVVYALLGGTAYGLLRRGHQVAAGVFAFAAVIGFAAFLAALFNWFGWLSHQGTGSTFAGFHTGRLVVELLTLAATAKALRIFRHPLLMLPVVLLAWLLVTDLLSGGGTWSAIVTLAIGLVFFVSALSADAGSRRPYGFWLHLAAGLTIGGSLLYFWHSGTFDWILVALASLVYIRLAGALGRASWAVLGALGLTFAAVYFTLKWSSVTVPIFGPAGHSSRGWVPPLVFAVTGVLLVALGLLLGRRQPVVSQPL